MSKCCCPSPPLRPKPSCCHQPSVPPPSAAALARVISSCREHLRCFETLLPLPCSCSMLRPVRIDAGPQAPCVTQDNSVSCTLQLPVTVYASDECGCIRSFETRLEIPCRSCGSPCPTSGLLAQSSVRLIDSDCPCAGSVRVRLEIWADLYRILLRPCPEHGVNRCPPPCLSWYPQPRY